MIGLQFDRPTDERPLLEAASVTGVEFSGRGGGGRAGMVISTTSERVVRGSRRGANRSSCRRASTSGPTAPVAGRYGFRHALYREAVYEAVPPARRAELHRRVGQRLESAHGAERAAPSAAELAMHFEQGREPARAIAYLQAAGEIAIQRSAAREAVAHLTKALDLLALSRPAPRSAAGDRPADRARRAADGDQGPRRPGSRAGVHAPRSCVGSGDTPELFPSCGVCSCSGEVEARSPPPSISVSGC